MGAAVRESEHGLFSCIGFNWRGQPLNSAVAIVNLIPSTRTTAGIRSLSELDKHRSPERRGVCEKLISTIELHPHRFRGNGNQTIYPHTRSWRPGVTKAPVLCKQFLDNADPHPNNRGWLISRRQACQDCQE